MSTSRRSVLQTSTFKSGLTPASSSKKTTAPSKTTGISSSSKVKAEATIYENEERLGEEVNGDRMLNDYLSYVTTSAYEASLKKAHHRIRADIDKQISALQKRVKDELDLLDKNKSLVDSLFLLEEQSKLLTHFKNSSQAISDEPAFTKGKSFGDLMNEIDKIKNQLPCKHVRIPETSKESADFQSAAAQLRHSMECISTLYGSDQTPISQTSDALKKMGKSQELLETDKLSIEAISSKACASVLNEATLKTSNLDVIHKDI